jgi:POT family proton-dependent oligopeptide transporter
MAPHETTTDKDLPVAEQLKILFGASRGFWLVNMVNFGDGIAYFGILTLLTRFLGQDLGMSDQWTGISVSTFTGLVTLFMFGGGFVSDKLGVRRALTWSLGVIGLGRLLLTLSPMAGSGGGIVAWVALMLMALGTGVLQPALYAGVKEYADPRTASIGYSLLYAIMNLGIVAESFVSPFVRESATFLNLGFAEVVGLGWGVGGVFWTCTILTGLMLLIHLTLFTRHVESTECLYRSTSEATGSNRTWQEKIRELPFLDPRFMYFIFILLPVRTLFAHQFLTMPDYVFRCFPAEVSAKFEWLNGLNPLIIVIFVPLITVMTRRVKVIDMMIAGTTLTAVTTFLLVSGPRLDLLIAYIILFSLGEAMWSSRFLEHVAELAPAGKVGAYMGLAGIPWFLAKFTTGFYSGFMLNHFIPETGAQDPATLWLIYGIIACVSPIALIATRRWLR